MTKKIKKATDQFVKSVKKKGKKEDSVFLIPTPSTTFNLECSGTVEGAFQVGKLSNLIGDSSSGKTLFCLEMLALCTYNSAFSDYHLIYDDVEAAHEFDIPKLFGEKVNNRLLCPNLRKLKDSVKKHKESDRSKTMELFNDTIAQLLTEEKPFIYFLDSSDALTTEAFLKLDTKNRKKRAKGNDPDGSYGDGKAKLFSEFCKNRIQDLKKHGSAIIVISQTRQNIGFGALFNPKTRACGDALRFYSCHEAWLACQKKEKTGTRTVVTNVQAKITKNKLTGRQGNAKFPILFDYGIDNISSCIDFLKTEGPWSGTNSAINTKGFYPVRIVKKKKKKTVGRSVLIKFIEDKNKEDELIQLCGKAYDELMESLKPDRKSKF